MPKWKWRCPLRWTFFGLSDKYIESVYKQFFQMKYHGNWNLAELYNLPIQIRSWFALQLQEQLQFEQDSIKEANKKGR